MLLIFSFFVPIFDLNLYFPQFFPCIGNKIRSRFVSLRSIFGDGGREVIVSVTIVSPTAASAAQAAHCGQQPP